MSSDETTLSPAELLDALGFQRYEARCFVALARLSEATAREISEVSDVPRTRVYDAVEQLEADGFVDVQHSNPQRFRAIPTDQAVALLRERYDERFVALEAGLESLDGVGTRNTDPASVWTTSGGTGIDARTIEFIDAAGEEIVYIVNDGEATSKKLLDHLRAASERDVSVLVGTLTEAAAERISTQVPDARLLDSAVSWLGAPDPDLSPDTDGDDEATADGSGDGHTSPVDEAMLGRIVIADRGAVLLSSLSEHDGAYEEHALWCDDVNNGLVLAVRRLLVAGLESADDSS